MTEIEYKIADLINFSSNQKPIEFADAFKSIITDRISSAIEDKKTSIAQTMFNTAEVEADDSAEDLSDDDDDNEIDTEVEIEDTEDAEVA